MKPSLPLTIASLLFATALPTADALGEPVTLDVEPVRISMFKNGLAMVTTRTEVPGPGQYQLPAPEARYGSLWLNWEPGLALDRIVATEVERVEEADVTNMNDLLRANVGRNFSIRLHNEDIWVTGKLVSIPTRPQPTPRQYIQPGRHGGYSPPSIAPPVSDLLIFQTESGTLALQPSQIAHVRFDTDEVETVVENKVYDSAISFAAEVAESEGDGVVLRYLAQGIAWSPSYVVEMINDETARLACKAVIVNDLMDLDGVDVELIAGYPNLRFAPTPTPMGPTPLAALLASLQQPDQPSPYGIASNAMVMQQRAAPYPGYGGSSAYTATIPDLPAGESAEDLYFYQVPDVTLAKGERGYFPLISAEVPGGHVYTWDIGDFIDRQDRYQAQPAESTQVVWHSLELTNTTDQPWTTAPGMTVMDGRVLGQDMLHFTPPNGTSLLKITQAVSIDAQQNEIEVERERNAETFHGHTYDRVTVEGTLSVTNYKDGPVTIKITKEVSGEVESADAGPKVVKIASGLRRVNPRSRLTWEVEVPPGREQGATIVYRYSFYTR